MLDAGCGEHESARLLTTAVLTAALDRNRGNLKRTAKMLEIDRRTLVGRLKKLGLEELPSTLRRNYENQLKLRFGKPAIRVVEKRATDAPTRVFRKAV